MGKKKWANKQTAKKSPSIRREENPELQPPTEERPPNPQPQEPIPQVPVMISLDVMTEFLRQQDPNRDWAADLADFSRIGGKWSMIGEAPAVPTSEPIVQPTAQPTSPSMTAPSEPSKPSPTRQETESMDIHPISSYYDSNPGEGEEKRSEEPTSQEGGDEPEITPAAEPIPQEKVREEIDLNETGRKQGLMTDEEFEALLKEVTHEEEEDASEAVREGVEASTRNDPEGIAHQPEEEVEKRQTGEREPEPVAPPVLKPKAVKRKLVLRDDPKAVQPKPKRVSQRCQGKWTSSNTKTNTAADPVEVLSDEERVTPTKPGEESFPATNLEDATTTPEVVSTTPSDQRDETEQMAEGLDLASESVGHVEPRDDSTHIRVETRPTAQDKPSTQAEKEPEEDEDRDEDRYQEERKRKGKAPVKRKPSSKKQRTGNIGIVITDPTQRTPPHLQEINDNDYAASEEPGSDSDISLEDEEYGE
ncbi:proteoglycan 4-like [Salvia splendens]|uniref:proteoglycan 4-like n=1 Tax=Salvia splendens TaxID=180675 RepID=UPI001C25C748|nr:proteoglycan 4-like [Salvia splendens]